MIEMDVVAEDLWFPEGPIAMADGSVLLVEIRRQTLTRVHPDGSTEIVANFDGGPNGAAIGPDGACYVVNNGGFAYVKHEDGTLGPNGFPSDDYVSGSVQRVDLATGEVTTLYTECDGRPLRGPNDLVFDADGGMWFTDPGKMAVETMHHGHLLYCRPDGSLIRRLRDHMVTPNGVGLSPDGTRLWVAETLTGRLHWFEITGPGEIAPEGPAWDDNVLGLIPGKSMLDSLAVEAGGRVCVGTLRNGGISIFDPESGVIEHVPVPDGSTTNICFGGPDMRTAWITGSHSGKLFRCRWPRPGLKLNFNA
jgi:gluconolactonase